jgi:DNA-binding PadR family transcriptional regulator
MPDGFVWAAVNELTRKVLRSFAHWQKETLDLHELFEAGGNDPEARTAVFDIVEKLVKDGLLKEEGNDFYSLTQKGKETAQGAKSKNE